MNTLIYLGALRPPSPHTLETMLQNGYINTIVRVGIDILCLFAPEKDLEAFFTAFSFKLYLQVVLPYLRLS